MKSSKTFNNISPELKKQIPKLQLGQSVVFQMINGVPNPEPDERERAKDPVLYPKVQLLTKFRLLDPHKGEYVDVGVVESWRGDDPVAFKCFVAGIVKGQSAASRFQGKFELKGGSVEQEELFEIFWLSPQRRGTLCPDASVEQIFEIQDINASNNLSLNKFEKLKKAIEISKDITPEKAREVMAALNQPTFQDDKTLLAKLKDFASSNVDVFLDTYESTDTPMRAFIKEALDAGVLSHDIATGEVKLRGVKMIDFRTDDPSTFVKEFSNWLKVATNQTEIVNNIKSSLEKKKA